MQTPNTCKMTISEPEMPVSLRVGTFNLANSLLDEKSETTNFFLREPLILDTIDKMKCDILAVTELRPYQNRVSKELCSISSFLGKIAGYDHIYEYMNATPLSFAMGILYCRSKVYPVKTVKYWLSETPETPSDTWGNGFGRILLGAKFYPVVNSNINLGAKPLWVYTAHLGLGEKEKNESVKIIPKLIQNDVGNDDFVFMGDMNFFEDGDRQGSNQRQILVESGMIDVGKDACFSFNSNLKSFGTFIGFEEDAFKSTYETLTGKDHKFSSRLDHIFSSNTLKTSDVTLWVEDEQQLIDRKTPSDHLPLLCTAIL